MMNEADGRTFIYRIDSENRICFVNDEWIDFARENEAPELTRKAVLGQPLDRFIAGWETKNLYGLVYESIRRRGRAVVIPFACDSPLLRRSFTMRLTPLPQGEIQFSVSVLRIKARKRQPALDNRIGHSSEIVVICSWCKRIRLDGECWVQIEQAIGRAELFGAVPPTLTHGVCPDCLAGIRRQIDHS